MDDDGADGEGSSWRSKEKVCYEGGRERVREGNGGRKRLKADWSWARSKRADAVATWRVGTAAWREKTHREKKAAEEHMPSLSA